MKTGDGDVWLYRCIVCGEQMRLSGIPLRYEMICPVDKWMLYCEKKARMELTNETS